MEPINNEITTKGFAIIGISFRLGDTSCFQDLRSFCTEKRAEPEKKSRNDGIGSVAEFDSAFFNISPREATLMDPQHRLLLECSWKALESAGYAPETFKGRIGVFAGAADNTYLPNLLLPSSLGTQPEESLMVRLANSSDHLSTRISYLLGLTGPSLTIHAEESTAGAAIHLACQSLSAFECDLALAGGVSIQFFENPDKNPDERCQRSNGVGLLVLRRMEDALSERDYIFAKIAGSAIGFSSSSQQKTDFCKTMERIVVQTYANAAINPETVEYIEICSLKDSASKQANIDAITNAYRRWTHVNSYCTVASKGGDVDDFNIATGIEALINVLAALKDGKIPADSGESFSNTAALGNTPFISCDQETSWPKGDQARRAAIHYASTSGYCAHLLIQSPPHQQKSTSNRPYLLFPISTKKPETLNQYAFRMGLSLQNLDTSEAVDAAYTLQTCRHHFEFRKCVVAKNGKEASLKFQTAGSEKVPSDTTSDMKAPPVFFLFSGQGMHHQALAASLYRGEQSFRKITDYCAAYLQEYAGVNILPFILNSHNEKNKSDNFENSSRVIQPAVFVIQYAMAKLWSEWGIHPSGVLGHSLGEITAACFAGVMTLDQALQVLARRGAIVHQLPEGSMAAVFADKSTVMNLLPKELELSAENGPNLFTVAGDSSKIANFIQQARQRGVSSIKLDTSHAFHSKDMRAAVEPLLDVFRSVNLCQPSIPIVSSVTGNWLKPEEAVSEHFWAEHIRCPVLFAPALSTAVNEYKGIFLEMGPGDGLTIIGQRSFGRSGLPAFYASMPRLRSENTAHKNILNVLAAIWQKGVFVNWKHMHLQTRHGRFPLPTYPFDRKRHWPKTKAVAKAFFPEPRTDRLPLAQWFSVLSWKETDITKKSTIQGSSRQVLLFTDDLGIGDSIAHTLSKKGDKVTLVRQGETFSVGKNQDLTIRPKIKQDYSDLLNHLQQTDFDFLPELIIYCWSYSPELHSIAERPAKTDAFFISLLWLIQTISDNPIDVVRRLIIVTDELYPVVGHERLVPEKSLIQGLHHTLPLELPDFHSQIIDIPSTFHLHYDQTDIDMIVNEIETKETDTVVAFRDGKRWAQEIQHYSAPSSVSGRNILREKGVYVITGGMGGIGLTIAKGLAREVQACLALVGRRSVEKFVGHDSQNTFSHLEQAIEEMQSMGAEVSLFSADVADLSQMSSVLDQVRKRWKTIHGVIHAAGIPGGSILAGLSNDGVRKVLRPKVEGTFILNDLTTIDNLDFMVFCSSLSSILGGAAQAHYSAANAFLDAFAAFRSCQTEGISLSIAWDTWCEVGMAVEADVTGSIVKHRDRQLEYGIKPVEGWEVFLRLLAAGQDRVFVSTRPFGVRRKEVLAVHGNPSPMAVTPSLKTEKANNSGDSDLLERIMDIWQKVLDVPDISPQDEFFDLGGNSLIGLHLLHQMQQDLKLNIPLSALKSISTPENMAKALLENISDVESIQKDEAIPSVLSEMESKKMMVVLGSSPVPLVRQDSFIKGYNTEGKKQPIFWCFNSPTIEPERLAKELGSNQPLYSLFSGVGVLEWKEETAENLGHKLGKHYIDDILDLQAEGPYWLGGNCAGARVAWGLANLLKSNGHVIDKLCFMEYFSEHLFDYTEPLLLLYGRQSKLEIYRKFNWLEPEWQKRFKVAPMVDWIPGGHGEFFQEENVGVLGNKLRMFYQQKEEAG